MRPVLRRALFLGLAVLASVGTGCQGDTSSPIVIVRDSAGITIVENRAPEWAEERAWYLGSDPLVEIGVLEGAEEYQLFRASSAIRLDDGRIVVAKGGTSELRFFDQEGRFHLSMGRPGDGPGEFRDLQWVWRIPGDSLIAYDFFPSRLSLFDPDGRYVSSVQVISPEGRQVFVLGPFVDGSLLVQGAPLWSGPGATEGVFQDSVPISRYSRDGAVIAELGSYPFSESFRYQTEAGWRMTGAPFAKSPLRTVAGDRFVFGPAEEYELQFYTLSGEPRQIVRILDSGRRVTQDDVEHFRQSRVEAAEQQGGSEGTLRLLRRLPVPEFMPPYERLVVDRAGHIWVADYRATEGEPRTWRVFNQEGRYLGDVEVPRAFEVLEVGDDYVLGRAVDPFGVEYIRLYPLHKPALAQR